MKEYLTELSKDNTDLASSIDDKMEEFTQLLRKENPTHKYDILSYILLAMPFIYPLVSLARGLSFPEMTSPVTVSYTHLDVYKRQVIARIKNVPL